MKCDKCKLEKKNVGPSNNGKPFSKSETHISNLCDDCWRELRKKGKKLK